MRSRLFLIIMFITVFTLIIIIFKDDTNQLKASNVKEDNNIKQLVYKRLYKPNEKIEILPDVFLMVLETNENFRTNIDYKQLKKNDKILRINLNILNNSKYDTHIGEFRCKTDNNIILNEFFQQYNKNHKIKPNDVKDLSLYYVYNDDKQKVNGVTLIYDNISLVKPDIFNIEIDFNPIG